MMLFVLIISSVLCLVITLPCPEEECDSGIELLQFQVNLSVQGSSLKLNDSAEVNLSAPVGFTKNYSSKIVGRDGTKSQSDLSRNLHNSELALHAGRMHVHEGRTEPIVSWVSAAILFAVFVSLLVKLVPLLVSLWERSRANEAAPEGDSAEQDSTVKKTVLPVLFYGTLYIVCSCALIKYNKFLMTEGRFPYAVNLTFGHQASGSIFLYVLFRLRPSLYPSLTEARGPNESRRINSGLFFRGLLPVALCFSGQLVLSNVAYIYTSVAFLQMMKEGNMVLVYGLSLLFGLEAFHGIRARVLLCLLLSTALTIQGELSFSMIGFVVQGTSQLMEATKIVLQSYLLSAAGSGHLDPYSYNLLVQPTTAFLLGCFLCLSISCLPQVSIASWAAIATWWPHLLANGAVALSLNVVIALFIAHSSAVGFIIAGITKDVVLILVDVGISGTQISDLQVFAFSLQILFVATYSLLKTFAKQLEPPKSKPSA